jgi:predicted RNA-binding protein YlxR (DUF448 family)
MRNPRNETLAADITGKRKGPEEAPERRCILSGRSAGRDGLLRLAISPPDENGVARVLPDALARAPGRGAWIGVSRVELEAAMAEGKLKGALARAFKGARLEVPDNLPELLEQALTRAFLDRLGLEMRAGKLILGSDRISNDARSGKVAALYHASDASEDGARKLDQAWRVGMDQEGSGLVGKRLPLDRSALSVALGRDNVVHLALADDAAAARVLKPLTRLMHFMGHAAPPADGRPADGSGDELNDTKKRNEQE